MADPSFLPDDYGWSPLMWQASEGDIGIVARLLHDPRVQGGVNLQNIHGDTALHRTCDNEDQTAAISIIHLLLQAGGNPAFTNNGGQTPLAYLRERHPSHHAAIALLEQYPEAQKDAEKASLFVKARRLVILSRIAEVPSYLQGRVARGQSLPRMALMPVTGGQDENENEDDNEEEEESREFRTLMAFLLGIEGGWKNAGMPRDVLRVVLELLMPSWDLLRRKNANRGPPAAQQD